MAFSVWLQTQCVIFHSYLCSVRFVIQVHFHCFELQSLIHKLIKPMDLHKITAFKLTTVGSIDAIHDCTGGIVDTNLPCTNSNPYRASSLCSL